MAGLVVDAIAKRDAQLPYVRIFLSVSDGAEGIAGLTTEQVVIESDGASSPFALTALYPEAFLPGKYIAVVQPKTPEWPRTANIEHNGEVIFKINVHYPGPPHAAAGHAQTVAYLPSRLDE